MDFKILVNGQVMKKDTGDTYEQWLPIGMEKEVHVSQNETTKVYQWVKFNLTQGEYLTDTTNTSDIIIDADGVLYGPNNPQSYTPVDGRVELPITQ